MQYINPITGKIIDFNPGQPIPLEYVKLNPNEKVNPMSGRKHSKEAKKRIGELNSQHMKGKHWFTNGTENKLDYECPEGFKPGRTILKD